MGVVQVIAEREFADSVRSRRFLLVLLVTAAIFALNLSFLSFTARMASLSLSDIFVHNVLSNLSFLAGILGVALGFAAISGEREKGTLKLVLVRPVRRDHVLLGKTLGAAALILVALYAGYIVLLGLGQALYNLSLPGDSALRGGIAVAFIALYSMVFYAAALFFSALARRSSQSMVAAIAFWLVVVLLIPVAASVVAISVAGPPPASPQGQADYWQRIQEIQASITGFTPEYSVNSIVNALLGSPFQAVVSVSTGNATSTLGPPPKAPLKPIPQALAGAGASIATLIAWFAAPYAAAYAAFVLRKEEK